MCEQISAVQDLQGKQLAELIANHMKTLGSDDHALTLERSLSQGFTLEDGGNFGSESDIQLNDRENSNEERQMSLAQRKRFSWAEKIQLF